MTQSITKRATREMDASPFHVLPGNFFVVVARGKPIDHFAWKRTDKNIEKWEARKVFGFLITRGTKTMGGDQTILNFFSDCLALLFQACLRCNLLC
jgi:hypothetical protein